MSAELIQSVRDIVTSVVTIQDLKGIAVGVGLGAFVAAGLQLTFTFGSVREHHGRMRRPNQRTVGESASLAKLI
jgi:hypothetical protein